MQAMKQPPDDILDMRWVAWSVVYHDHLGKVDENDFDEWDPVANQLLSSVLGVNCYDEILNIKDLLMIERLRALCGPHGLTIFRMLLARKDNGPK